ncbi:MAG TPA: hypothetical protein VFI24_10580 [Pyrinomonadaceae bacterium]|nr:hypothetical protein [Pyrinomonadaceae bacterium]
MSDYLNNIVARSLSVAEVVQPRVPHLFEQTVAATPVEMEPGSEGESVAETRMGSSEAPHTSSAPTSPEQMNPTVATPVLEQFQSDSRAPVALPSTPFLPEPSMPLAEATKKLATPNAPAPSANSVPASAQSTQQSRTVNQNATRVVDGVVPERGGPSQSERPTAVRTSEPVTYRTNASISPALPAALPPVNRAEPQPTPIRISIGRVDVRAIMPAGPAKAAAPARPKPGLSLESYLKQREEGKR